MSKFKAFSKFALLIGYLLGNSFGISAAEKPHEELMIIQTVSKDRRSFVVAKGIREGISKGEEVIFSNENVSLLCKAQEVNRNFSYWVPVDKLSNVPFNKDDFVSYNSHAYGNVALDISGDQKNLTPEVNYEIIFKKFRSSNGITLKASFDQGLSQSSSDVAADKNSKRSGFTFGAEYNFRFMPEFEMSAGIRFDSEVYRIMNPTLDIPTNRQLLTIASTYHFTSFSKDKNNFYLTLAAGFGRSTTEVDGVKSNGTVTLLPEARLGFIMPFSNTTALVLEGSIESLSTHETFADLSSQDTNILESKLTIGLRF
jgi:hypothetical protein